MDGGPLGTTATVTGAHGTATGNVTFKDGSRVLGTKALTGGRAVLTLSKTLTVGKHSITAVYAGAGKNRPSTAAAKALTVTKASSRTKAKLAKSTIKVGKKGKVTVTVTAIGTTPTGKVVIKHGSKVLRTVTLKNGKVTAGTGRLARPVERRSAVMLRLTRLPRRVAHPWRWYALGVILAAEVMDLLDSTVVGIAAPSIRSELGGVTPRHTEGPPLHWERRPFAVRRQPLDRLWIRSRPARGARIGGARA